MALYPKTRRLSIGGLVFLLCQGIAASSSESSQTGRQELVASVNGEPVTLDDLRQHLDSLHQSMELAVQEVQQPDPLGILDRVINVRLILQEARAIGLDELPAYQNQVETTRLELIRERVIKERLRAVTKGDPKEIEDRYRSAVREFQVESILFEKEEDAASFAEAASTGKDFKSVGTAMIAEGRAVSVDQQGYLKEEDMRPEVAGALRKLEDGQSTGVIPLGSGFTIVHLLDVRYPEDPAARAEAESHALLIKQEIELADYSDHLRKTYSTIDRDLVESLDYNAGEAAIQKLKGDSRAVVRIQGGEPITVSELTEALEKKFFHGIDRAAEQNRISDEIPGVLDRLILERATFLEAERLGIEQNPAFKRSLLERQESLLFGTFISKVVNPYLKLDEEELKDYYAENTAQYTTPEMVRLESMAFSDRGSAREALDSLLEGTDEEWLRQHAEGQVNPKDAEDLLQINRVLLDPASLPQSLQGSLEGKAQGDYGLYADPDGYSYVFRVTELLPPKARGYANVRDEIATEIYSRKRKTALDSWTNDLRQFSDIEILVTREQLRQLLGLGSEETT